MSFTLRQLQRLFSAAERGVLDLERDSDDLGKLGAFATGNERWRRAEVMPDGSLRTSCNCAECRQAGKTAAGVRSMVDRWAREYGPNADLREVIMQELAKRQPQQSQHMTQLQPRQSQRKTQPTRSHTRSPSASLTR
jgi:hypothetical protein